MEELILKHALDHPTHGALRVAQELQLHGTQVSAGGVRGVWGRHGLQTKHERLLRLEETVRDRRIELTDEQIRLLERYSSEFRERHIETADTGELVAVDTFYAGSLKGVDRIYLQCVLDCFSRYAWARFYTSKLPVTAVPILTGPPESAVPRDSFIERFHRTLLDEHLRVVGRTKRYESVDEMQTDLDQYPEQYNRKRPHQGRGMDGKTPSMPSRQGLPRKRIRSARPKEVKEPKQAA